MLHHQLNLIVVFAIKYGSSLLQTQAKPSGLSEASLVQLGGPPICQDRFEWSHQVKNDLTSKDLEHICFLVLIIYLGPISETERILVCELLCGDISNISS